MKLLSTKILAPGEQKRLAQAGFQVSQYDALTITLNKFEIPETAEHCIFTSQNAAQAYLDNVVTNTLCTAYCVGEKAALLLSENGHKIAEIGQNSDDLAQKIVKKHKNQAFFYFSGNLRRPELPLVLTQSQIDFKEVQAYTTRINYKAFETAFDLVLFYSPSGVQSFHKTNKQTDYQAICIGSTTANEASKHTNNYHVALHTTVAGVIDAALKAKAHTC